MKFKDYYQILGIGTKASPEEIKRAYKKRAHETHPDVPENKGKEEQFKDVSEAYKVLSNSLGRQKYDAQLNGQNVFGSGKGSNIDDLIDGSPIPPFGNQQPIQIKEYRGIKEVHIESVRGDINFEYALSDLVVLRGTGDIVRVNDNLTLVDFSGDIALKECEVYSKGAGVNYNGHLGVGGKLETTAGDISLVITQPLKIFTDTMNGKVHSKGFAQKRGYIVPAGYEGSERPLYLKTLLGDITLDFKPVR